MVDQTNNTEPVQLSLLAKQIVGKWWAIALICCIAGILGVFYASLQKTKYQSRLTFALDEGGSEDGKSVAASLAAQFGLSLGGAKNIFTGDNILEIMSSRKIIETVLLSTDTFEGKEYTMIQYYLDKVNPNPKLPPSIKFLPKENKNSFSYAKDSILFKIYNAFQSGYISAWRPNKKLNIFELNITTTDEIFTKKFTDKLIEQTNAFYTEISSKKAKETLAILEQRVPEMKNKLNSSIRSKAATQDANLNTAFSTAQVPILSEQANSQIYATAYAEMYKNLEMARFQYLKSIPLMQIIDTADYPMTKIKMGKLKTGLIFAVLGFFFSLPIFLIAFLRKNKAN